jgi:peptidoglycan/LPS O-acetylase OafA/YrhL
VINIEGYNLSYGIYLYAFPIQQLVISYFGYSINVWLHVAISALLATILGFLSWIFIESPFVRKKALRR